MDKAAYFSRMTKSHPTGTVRADSQVPNDHTIFFCNQDWVFVRSMGFKPIFSIIGSDRRNVCSFLTSGYCLIVYLDYRFEVF
jgi:hypothetical protein